MVCFDGHDCGFHFWGYGSLHNSPFTVLTRARTPSILGLTLLSSMLGSPGRSPGETLVTVPRGLIQAHPFTPALHLFLACGHTCSEPLGTKGKQQLMKPRMAKTCQNGQCQSSHLNSS